MYENLLHNACSLLEEVYRYHGKPTRLRKYIGTVLLEAYLYNI